MDIYIIYIGFNMDSQKNSSKKNSSQCSKRDSAIQSYKLKIKVLEENCLQISKEDEFKELFKGVVIMFIKDVILLYNKLLIKMPDLKYSKSSEKITNLNTLLNALETDGKLFNLDCNDIILRAYINYFYTSYRDDMLEWNLEKISNINENDIKEAVLDTASKENVANEASAHLNIIPEIVLMINNLKERDILQILYLLNNLNTVIDVYLVKKASNQF
jgi:hypothetical protein